MKKKFGSNNVPWSWTGELVKPPSGGEDDERDFSIAQHRKLKGLFEQAVPSLGEGDLPTRFVFDALHLSFPPHHFSRFAYCLDRGNRRMCVIFLVKKQTENEIWITKEYKTSGVSKNRNQTWQNFNVEANNGIFCAPEWVDSATKESITETLTQFSGRERNRGSSDWLIDGLVVPPIYPSFLLCFSLHIIYIIICE